MKHKYFLLFCLPIILLSCDDDDLKAPIPAYLSIDNINVKTQNGAGFQSQKITDAKVFINNQSLGFFELPASIPIQRTGAVNLQIRAGIRKNGISNDKIDYPFYTTYEEDIILEAEGDSLRNPSVEYFRTVQFETSDWSGEDFEGAVNFRNNPDSDSDLIRETNSSKVFEGIASGAAYLSEDQEFFETWSQRIFDIPRRQEAVFLELDYKSTHDFLITVYTNNEQSQTPIVFYRANTEWTKIYVDLGTIFSLLFTAGNYTIGIGYNKPLGEEGELLIDNVRLVHFDE